MFEIDFVEFGARESRVDADVYAPVGRKKSTLRSITIIAYICVRLRTSRRLTKNKKVNSVARDYDVQRKSE